MNHEGVNIILSEFGHNLRRIRENKGISLRQLAAMLESDHTWLSEVERGLIDVKLSTVYKVAEALGIKANELIPNINA